MTEAVQGAQEEVNRRSGATVAMNREGGEAAVNRTHGDIGPKLTCADVQIGRDLSVASYCRFGSYKHN